MDTICGKADKRAQWNVRNQDKTVNGLLLPKRWSDKVDKLKVRIILLNVYWSQTRTMARVLQISYSLIVMLEINGVLEVQYKEIIIISDK